MDFNVGASNRPCLGCKLDFASGLNTRTSKKVFRPFSSTSLPVELQWLHLNVGFSF